MINRIDHIGIAVENIEEQIEYYGTVLGLGKPKIEIVEEQKVKTAMFKVGEVRIELLEPISDGSPVARFLSKRGPGIHHIAYHVENIEEAINRLKENGIDLINDKPRRGTEGQYIAFVHPKSTYSVLTELCQDID